MGIKFITLLKETSLKWQRDRASSLSASLAFYALFAIVPVLVLLLGITGTVLSETGTRKSLFDIIYQLTGFRDIAFFQAIFSNVQDPFQNKWPAILNLILIYYGSVTLFDHLKHSFGLIWQTPARRGGFKGFLNHYFSSVILTTAVFLFLILTVSLGVLFSSLSRTLSFQIRPEILTAAGILEYPVTLLVLSFVFTYLFRYLPETAVSRRDAAIGGFFTGLLFIPGKYILALYLSHAGTASAYGAAGSVVVVLLWLYYSAEIFFFGAEFTYLYSSRSKSKKTQSKS